MNTTKIIKVGTEEHQISYPTVGQKLEIEARKMLLSKDLYAQLVQSGTLKSSAMLDIIDAYAYLSVLCPTLGLKVENFASLTPILEMTFVIAYRNDIVNWLTEIDNSIIEAILGTKENKTDDNTAESNTME